MAAFRPSTQRKVAAFITASALGTVCYAWVAKGGGARSTSALGRSSPTSRAFLSSTFGTRFVPMSIQSVSFFASSPCANRAMIPERGRCRICPAAECRSRRDPQLSKPEKTQRCIFQFILTLSVIRDTWYHIVPGTWYLVLEIRQRDRQPEARPAFALLLCSHQARR